MKVGSTVVPQPTTDGGIKPSPETQPTAEEKKLAEEEQQVQATSTGGGLKRPPN